jgi:hypothetical protein
MQVSLLVQSRSGISRRGTRLIDDQGTNAARSHKQLQASNMLPHWHVSRTVDPACHPLISLGGGFTSYHGAFRWMLASSSYSTSTGVRWQKQDSQEYHHLQHLSRAHSIARSAPVRVHLSGRLTVKLRAPFA